MMFMMNFLMIGERTRFLQFVLPSADIGGLSGNILELAKKIENVED